MGHEAARPFIDTFHAIEAELPGMDAPWLKLLRRNALAEFARLGVPTPRDEAWKYTDVRRFADQLSHSVSLKAEHRVATDELATFALSDVTTHRMVFVDGHYAQPLSTIANLPAGVVAQSMNSVLKESPEKVEVYLNDLHISSRFAILNTAMMVDGAYIEIDAGVQLDAPIELLFVSTDHAEQTHQVRNIVVAGERSKAIVIEHYVALGKSEDFTNAVTDLEIMAGANIEHVKLQLADAGQLHIDAIYANQHRDSRFVSHSIALGARLSRTDIHAELNGQGAECVLGGLYLVNGIQHVDHHTRIDHAKPHCRSQEYYKGVLDGRAHGVFNGKVVVHEDAVKTDASQSNGNLLLSKKAEVDTKPELEIYNDDVKCSHGATVGQLDENQLFYLRSRGFSEADARNALTFAFADEVLARLPFEGLRRYVERTALKKLPGAPDLEAYL